MKQIEIQGKLRFLVVDRGDKMSEKLMIDGWKPFCFLKSCTEEQAAELVDRDLDAYYLEYVNYGNGFNHDNAIDSLKSLLSANGIDLNEWKNPLILVYGKEENSASTID